MRALRAAVVLLLAQCAGASVIPDDACCEARARLLYTANAQDAWFDSGACDIRASDGEGPLNQTHYACASGAVVRTGAL